MNRIFLYSLLKSALNRWDYYKTKQNYKTWRNALRPLGGSTSTVCHNKLQTVSVECDQNVNSVRVEVSGFLQDI